MTDYTQQRQPHPPFMQLEAFVIDQCFWMIPGWIRFPNRRKQNIWVEREVPTPILNMFS